MSADVNERCYMHESKQRSPVRRCALREPGAGNSCAHSCTPECPNAIYMQPSSIGSVTERCRTLFSFGPSKERNVFRTTSQAPKSAWMKSVLPKETERPFLYDGDAHVVSGVSVSAE